MVSETDSSSMNKIEMRDAESAIDSKGSDSDSIGTVKNDQTHSQINELHKSLAEKHGVKRWLLQLKIDICIVLPICLLYLLAFLDRVNISNANAYGMSEDLGLKGLEYSIALCVFFVPYVVLEIPANWLLKKMNPSIFLPLCLLAFGGVSIGQGFVKNYHELIVTRVLLGALETAMFPSCFYLLGSWYTRTESQKRYSFFFSSTSLAGAFGGLIAYGCNNLNEKYGIAGWQWIFIIEGAITCFCGLFLFFAIADFPETARFLKSNERTYILEKLRLDQGDSNFNHTPTVKEILGVFKDWRVMVVALMYFGQIVGAYGYALFSTAIIKTFGFSPVQVQIHSIYPWVCTFGTSIVLATISDFFRHRYTFIMFCCSVAVVGYGLLLGTDPSPENRNVRYAACFMLATGMYTAMPIIVCWTNMNFAGHVRKMTVSAWQVGFGNIGGIISTFIYDNPPAFHKGLWVSLALILLSMGCCTIYFLDSIRVNRSRRRGSGQEWWDSLPHEKKEKAGDLNPSFRYMY